MNVILVVVVVVVVIDRSIVSLLSKDQKEQKNEGDEWWCTCGWRAAAGIAKILVKKGEIENRVKDLAKEILDAVPEDADSILLLSILSGYVCIYIAIDDFLLYEMSMRMKKESIEKGADDASVSHKHTYID